MGLRSIVSKSIAFGIFATMLMVNFSDNIFASGKENTIVKCWETKISGNILKKLYLDDNNAYVIDINGKLTAFSAKTGELFWSTDLGNPLSSNILNDESNIYLLTSVSDNSLIERSTALKVISKNTGLITKSLPLDVSGEVTISKANNGIVINSQSTKNTYFVSSDFNLSVFDTSINSIFRFENRTIALKDSNLFILNNSESKYFSAFSPTTVSVSENFEKIYLGDIRGNVLSFVINSKVQQWQFKTGAGINEVQITDKGLLAASQDNFIYLLSSNAGNVTWKRRVEGRISYVNILNKDVAVINASDVPEVQFIDLSNGKLLKRFFTDDINIPIYSFTNSNTNLSLVYSQGILTSYAADACLNAKKDAP